MKHHEMRHPVIILQSSEKSRVRAAAHRSWLTGCLPQDAERAAVRIQLRVPAALINHVRTGKDRRCLGLEPLCITPLVLLLPTAGSPGF